MASLEPLNLATASWGSRLLGDFCRAVVRPKPRECFLDICPGQPRRVHVVLANVAVEVYRLLSRLLFLDRELRWFFLHRVPSIGMNDLDVTPLLHRLGSGLFLFGRISERRRESYSAAQRGQRCIREVIGCCCF